ncbi:DUF6368 family protein [Streptomyces hydrogenans]|uniref:DUF6368 family protein n=1 Tax=Streptomyces hydrogenans TaxID=1873719 RepID=UPI00381F5095
MSGPVLAMELAGPVPPMSIQRLRELPHAVDAIAFCNPPVDHLVLALLTAAVMDVIGGVADAELREDQVSIVVGLPGIVATMTGPWRAAYGSAGFLRAWTQQPGFRLQK